MNNDHLNENLNAGLGSIVWWSMEDARVTPATLQALLESYGFQLDVPDINIESQIRRNSRGTHGRGGQDRLKGDIVYEDEDKIEVGLLRRRRLGEHEVLWEQYGSLQFSRETGALIGANHPQKCPLAKLITDRTAEAVTYHGSQFIRERIVKPLLAQMKALRCRGGVYFVPRQNREQVYNLRSLVNGMSRSQMFVVDADNTSVSADDLSTNAAGSLREQLEEHLSTMAEWRKASRKVRGDVSERVLSDLDEMLETSEMWELALGVALDDIRGEVRKAKIRAAEILEDNLAEFAPKKTTRKNNPPDTVSVVDAEPAQEVKVYTERESFDAIMDALIEGVELREDDLKATYGDAGKRVVRKLAEFKIAAVEKGVLVAKASASELSRVREAAV